MILHIITDCQTYQSNWCNCQIADNCNTDLQLLSIFIISWQHEPQLLCSESKNMSPSFSVLKAKTTKKKSDFCPHSSRPFSETAMLIIGKSFLLDSFGTPGGPKVAIWRKRVGSASRLEGKSGRQHEAEWKWYHSTYSIFITATYRHLWPGGSWCS